MGDIFETIKTLFTSQEISKTPFYKMVNNLKYWRESGKYSTYGSLPAAISFPPEFWKRIYEIHRHTVKDGHERAIRVWWVDGEFVLTDSARGEQNQIVIPEEKVTVSYRPVKGTKTGERIIEVNSKVYSKRTVDVAEISRKKNLEVVHLFNMHTHPPQREEDGGKKEYGFFSATDINSFLSSTAAVTGLVTDKLWILIKTERTPRGIGLKDQEFTSEYLTQELGIKVYKTEMGRSAIVVGPHSEWGRSTEIDGTKGSQSPAL